MAYNELKENLVSNLEKYKEKVKDNTDIQIDIIFVKKINHEYKASTFLARNEHISNTVADTIEYAISCSEKREYTDYDFEYSKDQTVEVLENLVVRNQEVIEGLFSLNPEKEVKIDEKTNLNSFDFLAIQLADNSGSLPKLFLYKKHLKEPAKYKSGKRFLITGEEEVELMKENVLVISSTLDALSFEENMYIFNRSTFNSIMDFTEYYIQVVDDKADDIKKSGLFSDADVFIENCKVDGRYLPRLTKIILEGGFDRVEKHKSKLKKIKKDYDLKLIFNSKGEINTEESPVNEVLNLLADHYVVSALTADKRVALGFEK